MNKASWIQMAMATTAAIYKHIYAYISLENSVIRPQHVNNVNMF